MRCIREGRIVYSHRPADAGGPATTVRLRWSDLEARRGKHYYYVRELQKDGELPDGDPEMAWASPFFVTRP